MDAQKVVDVLNRALKADPDAINDLFQYRVVCNSKLGEDPIIQVRYHRKSDGSSISALGLINGILGTDEDGRGFIEAVIDVGTKEILSFQVSKRYTSKRQEPGDR
jgi:hypothetical protein